MVELMVTKSGNGRKWETVGIEGQIITELESNNYHTCQKLVDMIEEGIYVGISRSSIGRLKTSSGS